MCECVFKDGESSHVLLRRVGARGRLPALTQHSGREFIKLTNHCYPALESSVSASLSCSHDISAWIYLAAFVCAVCMCICCMCVFLTVAQRLQALRQTSNLDGCMMLSFNDASKVSNALCVCDQMHHLSFSVSHAKHCNEKSKYTPACFHGLA